MAMSDSELWPVFLTATADAKTLNHALLRIQGWEYSEYLCDSSWTLLSSRAPPAAPPAPTTAPFPARNAFTGASLAEINAWLRSSSPALEECNIMLELWLVLDDAGLRSTPQTCVVCKQCFDGFVRAGRDGEEEGELDEDDPDTWTYGQNFEALRVPLDQAWVVFDGLAHRGMEFIDYQGSELEPGPDGTMRFKAATVAKVVDLDVVDRREKAWGMWREQGLVD
ncbi:hypothetical protein DFH09DRAFT_392163 [Mycena vulgaris]|nr:hypothetical protein DFH09DRAFT_392163 [Mycena vulgaris]